VVTLFEEVSDLEARRRDHIAKADSKRGEIAKLLGQLEDEEKAEQRSRKDIAEIRRREEAEQRRQESRAQGIRSSQMLPDLRESIEDLLKTTLVRRW
jgi:molecular chaperone GrpE (heat shock protein)